MRTQLEALRLPMALVVALAALGCGNQHHEPGPAERAGHDVDRAARRAEHDVNHASNEARHATDTHARH